MVGYDPASLKPVACQRGPAFDVGVCNRTYDRNGDGTPDAVLFAVLSLNGVSSTDTAVPLANITWQAVVAVQGETTTALSVEVRTFTDTDGLPLTYTTQDGRILPSAAAAHYHTENLSAFGITHTVENE